MMGVGLYYTHIVVMLLLTRDHQCTRETYLLLPQPVAQNIRHICFDLYLGWD
jgi:hypothetical protein